MKVELECKQCGKKFELESWRSKNRLFCCRQCGADNKKKNIVSKICEFCGKEFTPLSYEKNRRLHPDILIDKLIIECQGDYFHCNPSFFKEDYLNLKTNKYAKDIWREDRERKKAFEEAGYKVFYIWESEWKKNKSNLIKKIEYEISKNQIN